MKFFWEVFVTLFVVIDPPGTVPIFLGLTSGRPTEERNKLAWQAALVAFGVIVVFALFGQLILAYLGVQLAALEGAGGLLLLLVALQLLTGTAQEPTETERQMANVAFVPLGTPLLAGLGPSSRRCFSSSGSAARRTRSPFPQRWSRWASCSGFSCGTAIWSCGSCGPAVWSC
jgi:MarC family membrane protein